jgi:hypothetical protein
VWIVYSVIVVPVQIAFSINSTQQADDFDLFVSGLFFIDIVLSFRTAYESGGEEAYVIVPTNIVLQYLKSWFIIDIASTIPFDVVLQSFFQGSGGSETLKSTRLLKTLRLIRLLKLFRILKLSKYVQEFEDVSGISPVVFDFFKLLIEVLFIGHFVACIWWYTTHLASQITWANSVYGGIQNLHAFDQYLASLYWTFATMTTVGFGDITSVNMSEQLINIFLILVVVSVFGYILANVSTLLSSFNPNDAKKNEKMSEITEYLNEKGVRMGLFFICVDYNLLLMIICSYCHVLCNVYFSSYRYTINLFVSS